MPDPNTTNAEDKSEIEKHRATAEKARRMARMVSDQQTIDALTELARENDFDADYLAGGVENRRMDAAVAERPPAKRA